MYGLLLVARYALLVPLRWVLGPLDQAARNRQYPMQFGLADLLCLCLLVQIVVSIVHWSTSAQPRSAAIAFDVVLSATVAYFWWIGVRTLSRAGIQLVWHRCIFLTIVMPGAIVGAMTVFALPVAVIASLLRLRLALATWLFLAEAFVIGILFVSSRLTRTIVAAAMLKREDQDAGEKV